MKLTSFVLMLCLGCAWTTTTFEKESAISSGLPVFCSDDITDMEISQKIAEITKMIAGFQEPDSGDLVKTLNSIKHFDREEFLARHNNEISSQPTLLTDLNKIVDDHMAEILVRNFGPFSAKLKQWSINYMIFDLKKKETLTKDQERNKLLDNKFVVHIAKAVKLRLDQLKAKAVAESKKEESSVKQTLGVVELGLDRVRDYLENRFDFHTKLSKWIWKISDSLKGDGALGENNFMLLNDRCFEYAKAIHMTTPTEQIDNHPLAAVLDDLIRSRYTKEPEKRGLLSKKYLEWNGLLIRRILEILEQNGRHATALKKMQDALVGPSGQQPNLDDGYAQLLNQIYQRTNPIPVFDGNSNSTHKRKIFWIEMIRHSKVINEKENSVSLLPSQEDFSRVVSAFEKLLDVRPETLDALNVGEKYFTQLPNLTEAINSQPFLELANNLLNSLAIFESQADPADISPEHFPFAFNQFLDKNLETPEVNLKKHYPHFKVLNGVLFLAESDKDPSISFLPFSEESLADLKANVDQPAFEPVKRALLSAYADNQPLYLHDVEEKTYVPFLSGKEIKARVLKKPFTVQPNPDLPKETLEQESKPIPGKEIDETVKRPEDQKTNVVPVVNKGEVDIDDIDKNQNKDSIDNGNKKPKKYIGDGNFVKVVSGKLPPEIEDFLRDPNHVFSKENLEQIVIASEEPREFVYGTLISRDSPCQA